MTARCHFTSLRSDWRTPRKLFEMLDREFHFTVDAAPGDKPVRGELVGVGAGGVWRPTILEYTGALDRPWEGVVYCNPPYGREIGDWVEKAHRESRAGHCTVVMLIPSRTDTSWWHDYVLGSAEVRFLRGRLSFDDDKRRRAPFPSAVVIFRENE